MKTIALRTLAVALLMALPHAAMAQTPPAQPAQPASAPSQQLLSGPQLDALVAPIALYPDALLSEILMASTYPLEVVEADRWVGANKTLQGDALKSAVDQQNWDDSIKSLTATPDVLDMMNNKLDWTQQLGDAVLAQQPDVMDAVQRLRAKAQANNKLNSSNQQTVTTQSTGGREYIAIAPTDPDEIYVPYYDPAVVYGPWPYPDYPFYYWPPPVYIGAAVIATGIAFGTGYALGRWASGGYRWGGGFNWGGNNIVVNRSVNVTNINVNNWQHNPAHRQGVPYRNANVATKFGGANAAARTGNQLNFRGSGGQQVLQPGTGNRNLGGTNAGTNINANVNRNTGTNLNRNTGTNLNRNTGTNLNANVNRNAGTNANLNRSANFNRGGGGGGGGGSANVGARSTGAAARVNAGGGGGGQRGGGAATARGGGGAARGNGRRQ